MVLQMSGSIQNQDPKDIRELSGTVENDLKLTQIACRSGHQVRQIS